MELVSATSRNLFCAMASMKLEWFKVVLSAKLEE